MDGWELKRQLREYIESNSPEFRNNFTLIILSYAQLIREDTYTPLSTYEVVNDVLESWMNVEIVFNAVLDYNNIDYDLKVERNNQWHFAGEEMAAAFIAATSYMMQPAIEAFGDGRGAGKVKDKQPEGAR
jgi:hypothetical protein